ncbi:MAG: thioredoxin domain-containing protein [Neisseriaceae bacterium]|nr:MAG: thioredoxin domain-containing protein [Neisseriaceae bacterium]
MKYRHLLLLTSVTLAINLSFASLNNIKEGRDYTILEDPIESIHPDKVELVEVFSYVCTHCKDFDPILKKYESHLDDPDVAFRNIHVFWAPEFLNLIRLSVAVDENQMTQVANNYIFQATFNDKVNFFDEKTTIEWLNKQTNFDGKKIAQSYQTPHNKNKAKDISILSKKYKLETTPNIVIGGKYKVSLNALKSETDLVRILDGLINLSKKDKLPINVLINTGGEFVHLANQSK